MLRAAILHECQNYFTTLFFFFKVNHLLIKKEIAYINAVAVNAVRVTGDPLILASNLT